MSLSKQRPKFVKFSKALMNQVESMWVCNDLNINLSIKFSVATHLSWNPCQSSVLRHLTHTVCTARQRVSRALSELLSSCERALLGPLTDQGL